MAISEHTRTTDPFDAPAHDGVLGSLQEMVRDYEWFHTLLGILGNLAFLVGSVLFLFESTKQAGVWLFIIGSAGMLIGSAGSALVRRARRRHRWARPGEGA